jgi:hypothetical protein
VYVFNKDKVIITCKEHGDFEQVPNMHLAGNGCPKCGSVENFSRSSYVKKSKGRKCIFYILKCFDENEEFYKIGITMNSVNKRYKTKKSLPYSYQIISEIYGEAEYIWDLEKEEKKRLRDFNYQPLKSFCGSKTECFIKY